MGCILAALFVTDQLLGAQEGARLFPWLHTKLMLNYTYRGLWGTIAGVVTLFAVSSFTKKTDAETLARLTVGWKGKRERYRGIFDWRFQLVVLSIITILLYWLVW